MVKWLLILVCIWPSLLLEGNLLEQQQSQSVATTEGLPSSLVNRSVCVISGEYVETALDFTIPGPESLTLRRHYGSQSRGSFCRAWYFNHLDKLITGEAVYHNRQPVWVIGLRQPSGTQLDYIYPKSQDALKKKHLQFELIMPKGFTNGAQGLSGQTNLKNQTVHFYPNQEKITATLGNGDRRTFVHAGSTEEGWIVYGQKNEEKVNGSIYEYECKGKGFTGLSSITCASRKTGQVFGSIKFNFKAPILSITTSDGRSLSYHFKPHQFKIVEKTKTSSSEREINCYYLAKVDHPYAPCETYEYKQKELSKELQMIRKQRKDHRFVNIHYYHKGENRVGGPAGAVHIEDKEDYRLDRVKRLQAPVGTDQTPITTHRFVYHSKIKENKQEGTKELLEGFTDVYDAQGHLVRYAYDAQHRLSSIKRYKGSSKEDYILYNQELFLWGKEAKQEGNLLAKIFMDGQGNVHHARYFSYDEKGNVLTSTLCGRLTGKPSPELRLNEERELIDNGYEKEQKQYTYSQDEFNLVLSETDSNGKTTLYRYIKGTNHLKAKYLIYQDQIQTREFYTYNDHYVLIKKIVDDGKTQSAQDLTGVKERRITLITPRQTAPFGLPETVEEYGMDLVTGQECLIQSTHYHYSPQGRLLKQEIFDANREFAYALSWDYDQHGNVILERNALGEEIRKEYDDHDNLIFQQGPYANVEMHNTYDYANRLIRQVQKIGGDSLSTTHTYDYLGNCIATINPYGHETRQTFDDFGRLIATHHPPVLDEQGQVVYPVTYRTYDIAGYPICIEDAKGHKRCTEYNIRGQPTKIIHPDGTCEQFVYRLDGQLMQKTERNGTSVVYERDELGRVLKETFYGSDGQLLKSIQQVHDAFHLVQAVDAEGCITEYSYDMAGRLEWKRQGDSVQQHLYDALGRLVEIREWFGNQPHEYRSTIKVYDLLNRVIEERLQAADGAILHLARYAYDCLGNQTLVQTGDQVTQTAYDAHSRPISITNALGKTTYTVYNMEFVNTIGQKVLQAITTDPLGYQTIQVYDAANRLVDTVRCHPLGMQVAHQAMFYDLCGNLCRLLEDAVQEGKTQRILETQYLYNPYNQEIALIEAAGTPEQKIKRTSYNPCGQIHSVTKPDGNVLFYTYDALGRVHTLTSQDGSIAYAYTYDKKDQLIKVCDLKTKQITERVYDKQGHLKKETLGHGLSLQYQYDRMGRAQSIELPNQTGIEYGYDAVDLKEIHRIVAGKRVYSHFNRHYTLGGQVTEVELPGDNGYIHYTYNALGRCTSIASSAFHQSIPEEGFDAVGNLLCLYAQGVPYHFTYDDHYHIQTEEGPTSHTYAFDSLSNRIAKDGELHVYNALNQLTQKGQEKRFYDANGNLIKCINGEKVTLYAYDALDRLISVQQEGQLIVYTYDPFHRRLTRKRPREEEERFLYQGQEEIGLWHRGALKQLRVLGKQGMVALELEGVPYVPIHDMSGHVACLLNHKGQVVERYRYTVFGERKIFHLSGEEIAQSKVGNPWQYASKRWDEETNFVAFGLRYYEPALGRWITPDPAGFTDGSNLYAYVHNRPLVYHDEFGLFTNFSLSSSEYLYSNTQYASCFYTGFQNLNAYAWGRPEPEIQHIAFEHHFEERYRFRESLGKKQPPFERTATYSLNDGYLHPGTGQPFQLKTSLDKAIVYINGIANKKVDFDESLTYLGMLSEYNIQGVHSASFGFVNDAICYLKALHHYVAYEAVRELHTLWHDFFKNCADRATFLVICHSRGAVYVRNALIAFPDELRKRIEVIAVAPGAYIDPALCKNVRHYVSKGDIVPLLDVRGRQRCKDTIITLDRHPQASGLLDHTFTSPTYTNYLKTEIKAYSIK